MHDDNAGLSAAELLELNRDLQGSRAIRLLATTNLSLYATLMERHLGDGAAPRDRARRAARTRPRRPRRPPVRASH